MTSPETMADRVRARLDALRINVYEAERRAGLRKGFVEDLFRTNAAGNPKKSSIGGDNLSRLADALECDEGYLLRKQAAPRKLISTYDPDEPDHPEKDDRMVEGEFHRNVGDLPSDAILQVDVSPGMGGGGFTLVDSARADDGNFYAVEGVRDWLRLPDELVRGQFRVPSKRVRAFTADGDSMEPTIRDGDLVFVDISHTTPSPPGIYALNDAFGGVILKRLEVVSGLDPEVRVLVKSDNPLHTTKEHSIEEIVIRGRYLGRLTTRFD